MGFLDELKEEYKKGQEDGEKLFGKKKEANASTSEPANKKLLFGKIAGGVILGAIGAVLFGLLGFLIGAVIGFFAGGFILSKIKGLSPKLSTDGEDILTNTDDK